MYNFSWPTTTQNQLVALPCPDSGLDGYISRLCCGPGRRGYIGGNDDSCTIERKGEWLEPLYLCFNASDSALADLIRELENGKTKIRGWGQAKKLARQLASAANASEGHSDADIAGGLEMAAAIAETLHSNGTTADRVQALHDAKAVVHSLLKKAKKKQGSEQAVRALLKQKQKEKQQDGSTFTELAPDAIVNYAGSLVAAFRALARDVPPAEKLQRFVLGSYNISLLADRYSSKSSEVEVTQKLAATIPTAVGRGGGLGLVDWGLRPWLRPRWASPF